MLDAHAPAFALPVVREAVQRDGRPLSWRLACPLIGGASAALWVLVAKAVALVFA